MPREIELRVTSNGSYSVVQVEGDINQKTSSEVRTAIFELLQKHPEKGVIVDLKRAEHIDDIGACILMEAFEVAYKRDMDFILIGLN